MTDVDFQPLGDSGIRVRFRDGVSPELNGRIRSFCRALEKEKIDGVVEWVPAYETATVYYRADHITYGQLCEKLAGLRDKTDEGTETKANMIYIPTLYNGKDLPKVAELNGLSEKEVIDLHTGTNYLIYMMGFLPGFPYLGGMSKKIAAPRLETPRSRVPAGSVGIAGEQTGIYPLESPGGWNIIGSTPLKLFAPGQEHPFLFQPGDTIRFEPVSEKEYEKIKTEVQEDRYRVKREAMNEGKNE